MKPTFSAITLSLILLGLVLSMPAQGVSSRQTLLFACSSAEVLVSCGVPSTLSTPSLAVYESLSLLYLYFPFMMAFWIQLLKGLPILQNVILEIQTSGPCSLYVHTFAYHRAISVAQSGPKISWMTRFPGFPNTGASSRETAGPPGQIPQAGLPGMDRPCSPSRSPRLIRHSSKPEG